MKKIFVIILGIVLSSAIYAQNKNALVIELTDGSANIFLLAEKPVVTLQDGYVVINGSVSTTYVRSEVEKLYFVYDDGSGIKAIGKGNFTFCYANGGDIQISGLKERTIVSVMSLAGKIISSQEDDGTGRVTISLKNHPTGTYIISLGDRCLKIRN